MHFKEEDFIARLPPETQRELLPVIREEFIKSGKTVVVLDDDPTGTQTCYDTMVLTSWTIPLLAEELEKKPSILFILTNSRSMPEQAAVRLAREVGENLRAASIKSGRQIAVISRSDSTLRGHFPAEVDAVAGALNLVGAVTVIVPAFIEGGRLTFEDVHYIREEGEFIPVADTPFARDAVFGYRHSNLKEWVSEKTKGRIQAADVVSISLNDIRLKGPQMVAEKLQTCLPGQVCIVNACSYRDLEVFVMGLLMAEQAGQTFLYRTSATFVSIRAGIAPGKIFNPEKPSNGFRHGSLTVVGSYVPKTTRQLSHLLNEKTHHSIEVDVSKLFHSKDTSSLADAIIKETDSLLASGDDVVIHTSRQLEKGADAEASLHINAVVSAHLVSIVRGITTRPAFMIAKGGITSSDLATKALSSEKALILGQVIPGVPVWRIDAKSKFADLLYVVFPGNVGNDGALTEVWRKLKGL